MFMKEKSASEKVAEWASDHTAVVSVACFALLAVGVVTAALVGDDESTNADG